MAVAPITIGAVGIHGVGPISVREAVTAAWAIMDMLRIRSIQPTVTSLVIPAGMADSIPVVEAMQAVVVTVVVVVTR